MHDLWHVVTGYGTDLIGELALIAFTNVQLPSRAFRMLVTLGRFFNEFKLPGTRALVGDAERRAREAVWLPAQDWEALLERPLDEIRETLRVGPPPSYTKLPSPQKALRLARADPQRGAGDTSALQG